jgi:hypothetical protein
VKQSGELPIPIPDGRAAHESAYLPGPQARGAVRPRILRMPAEWWDSPAVSCPLSRGLQSARTARRLTSSTLCDWGLMSLAEDAETIVGELAANAHTRGRAGCHVLRLGWGEPGLAPASRA